ncbi:MAG: glycosyltransferase family 39 protein [Chloroflexi bacterium]|nr:glycosyltransferase family 39 protein [Chloroflexota bacterium]
MHTPNPKPNTRTLLLIVGVAIALRVAVALLMGNRVDPLPGIYDQISYSALAQRVATGHGFSFDRAWYPFSKANEPTAHWSFLYTLYLSAFYWLLGYHPFVPRLVQAIAVGLLTPLLTYRLGRRLFGHHVGLVAAAWSAVYGYLVYYSGALFTEPFYIIVVLWAFDRAFRIADTDKPTLFDWIALGVAVGIATLLRQVFLLFAPFLFAWIWWSRRQMPDDRQQMADDGREGIVHRPSSVVGLVLTTLVVAAFILPWTIRNYRAYGHFLFLNSNGGYFMYSANDPANAVHFSSTYVATIPGEWRQYNEAELDQRLWRQGMAFFLQDPTRSLRLVGYKAAAFYKFWPSSASSLPSNINRVLSFGLYLPFLLYGLYRAIVNCQLSIDNCPFAALLLLFGIVYPAIHLLSWSMIRYRVPVDAVLMPFAALGLLAVAERVLPASWQRWNEGPVEGKIQPCASSS